MQISDFQDAVAYVMAKTGCRQDIAEDALYDGTTVEETIIDYYQDEGDYKTQEEQDRSEAINSRYEAQLESIATSYGGYNW